MDAYKARKMIDSLMKLDVTEGPVSNFVRKLNKEETKFEKLRGGWGKFVGPQNR